MLWYQILFFVFPQKTEQNKKHSIYRTPKYIFFQNTFTSLLNYAATKSLQSCLTLCDPIDGSPPGFAVPGILQARTLEWVAISFPSAWKWKVNVRLLNCVQLLATPWTAAYQAPLSMGFSRQEYCSGVPLPSPYWTITTYKTRYSAQFSSVQSFSLVWLFATPWTATGQVPVHYQLLEYTQTHFHRIDDAIQLSHPLLSPSPLAFNLSKHQGLFKWVSYLHQVDKVLEFHIQHQSFQWMFRTDLC